MNPERRNIQRSVYLITYSKADEEIIPSRESFACVILDAWSTVMDNPVVQWVVSKEKHNNVEEGSESSWHYHMAIKLEKKCRWLQVRNILQTRYNVKVNFSNNHSNYYTAYQYVTKEDETPVYSEGHPDLRDNDRPKTTQATQRRQRKPKAKKARERLSVYDVVQIIREKKITNRNQLLVLAERQRKNGKSNLAEFISNRGFRVVNEALSLAEEFQNAEAIYVRSSKTRLDILREQLELDCVQGCDKRWLSAALDLLNRNGINERFYCDAIYTALNLGRGKYRNIFIHGPSNCGKTFMISPLKTIYKAFVNPACGTFAWVGAETAEVVLLNDFRWCPAIIAWSDFLQILEGDSVHLPTPKNFLMKDLVFDKDTPFFATSDAPITLVRGGAVDSINTEMMSVRWRAFQFTYQVKESERRELTPCNRCFAELVLHHKTP